MVGVCSPGSQRLECVGAPSSRCQWAGADRRQSWAEGATPIPTESVHTGKGQLMYKEIGLGAMLAVHYLEDTWFEPSFLYSRGFQGYLWREDRQ